MAYRYIRVLQILLIVVIINNCVLNYVYKDELVKFQDIYLYYCLVMYSVIYFILLLSSNKLNKLQISIKKLNDKESCSICLIDSNLLYETECKHLFHEKCITEWITKHQNNSCPLCRTIIVKDEVIIHI